MEELNSGPPKTNPSSGREEDLNPGPLDYKSSTLPLGHAHLAKLLTCKNDCTMQTALTLITGVSLTFSAGE